MNVAVSRKKLLKDAQRGARNILIDLKRLERETGSEVFISQANEVRRRISIYSQEQNEIKKLAKDCSPS